MGIEQKPESGAKIEMWTSLENIITIRRGDLTDAQVYRLLTDFAEAHKQK